MFDMVELLIALVVIVFSMMLHELAHGCVAYFLGDDTAKEEGRLTLNPLKHLDPVLSLLMPLLLFLSGGPIFGGAKPVPVDTRNLKRGAWGMALVAIAGPAMNFLLAFLTFMIGSWTGEIMFHDGTLMYTGSLWGEVLVNMVYINLGFGIFNLIPIPPLDGSRVLYVLMPDGVRRVMEEMERWGIMIVLVIMIIGSGLISALIEGVMTAVLQVFSLVV